MSAFQLTHGFTIYFYVQHSTSPRYPYGVCGPFATEGEALAAMDRIGVVFPDVEFHIEQGTFADDSREMLTKDNAQARQRLEAAEAEWRKKESAS